MAGIRCCPPALLGELDKLPSTDHTQILFDHLIAIDSREMNCRGAFVAFVAEQGLK